MRTSTPILTYQHSPFPCRPNSHHHLPTTTRFGSPQQKRHRMRKTKWHKVLSLFSGPPKKGNQPERFVMAIDGAHYVAALGGLSPVARLPYPANKCFLEIPLLARLKFTTCFSFESVESCTITEQFRCMNHYNGRKQTVVIFGLCAYTLFRFRCY